MKNEIDENRECCKVAALELDRICAGDALDDDGEPIDIYDYLSDILDYTYIIDSQGNYEHARIYITLGGPTVWIDTETANIELRWASNSAFYPIAYETRDIIDDYMNELWEMNRQ